MVSETSSARFIFSINGPDNVGKTTQVEMLPSRWGIQKMKGIPEYHAKLDTSMNTDELKEWWFETDDRDFVETIRSALKNRRECATQSSHPVVFDGGATMFKAICVARIALRNGVDVVSAGQVFTRLTKGFDMSWPTEDHAILITYAGTVEENVTQALGLDKNPDDQYRAYQVLLHQVLELQVSNGCYSAVISRTGKNCLEVHNEICRWLWNNGMPESWTPLLSTVSCVIGLGGLSEAGKSTVATATAAHFGNEGIRLKIAYFMDLASRELKGSVYDLPEDEQACWLIREIDRFASAHKWLKVLCMDSVHSFCCSETLRRLLDGKSLLVYMDSEESVRFSRVNISKEKFIRKDKAKTIRGGDRIKEIADIVVDNNGRFEDAVAQVTGAVHAHIALQLES